MKMQLAISLTLLIWAFSHATAIAEKPADEANPSSKAGAKNRQTGNTFEKEKTYDKDAGSRPDHEDVS